MRTLAAAVFAAWVTTPGPDNGCIPLRTGLAPLSARTSLSVTVNSPGPTNENSAPVAA